MKKWSLVVLLAGILTACQIQIILPDTTVPVGGSGVESELLGEGESARFSLLVGSSPLRVDVTDVTNAAAGSLRLRVYDANDVLYAQTVSRRYFTAPEPEVLDGSGSLGINPTPVYSINLPASFGMAYIEVTNLSHDPTVARVRAVTRNGPLPAGDFSATASGALLFLRQLDSWKYTGSATAKLELQGGETVHARAKVVRGQDTKIVLEPGESFSDLRNGDLVLVQTHGNGALAGFCDDGVSDNGKCDDGIKSGEYTLLVTP